MRELSCIEVHQQPRPTSNQAHLQVVGLGSQQYFNDSWNKFDFALVLLSLTTFILEAISSDSSLPLPPSLLRIVRTVRTVRVVRTLRGQRAVMRHIETLARAMPAVSNVMALMALVIYIYALLGMSFFGHIEFDKGPNELYNRHANFRSFHTSCLTLFRMATGESWNGIMHDCMAEGGEFWWSWLYFCSFMLVGAYMILNLLIAIVLETFQRVMKLEEAVVKPLHVTGFLEVWSAFDPEQFSFIDAAQLKEFLRRLEEPLWPNCPGLGPNAVRPPMKSI